MSKEELKFKVISRLINGEDARFIEAEVEGSSYSTILRWKREFEAAQAAGTLDELIDMDAAMFGEVLQGVKDRTPAAIAEFANESIAEIGQAKTAAESLQLSLHTTAANANTKVRSLLLSTESISEVSLLVTTLCDLQNAFFNKNSTQVNVQNNYDQQPGQAYSSMLDDKPAVNAN